MRQRLSAAADHAGARKREGAAAAVIIDELVRDHGATHKKLAGTSTLRVAGVATSCTSSDEGLLEIGAAWRACASWNRQEDMDVSDNVALGADPFDAFDPHLFAQIGTPVAAAFRTIGQLRGLIENEDTDVSPALVDAAFMQAHMLGLAEIIADLHPDDSRDEAVIASLTARLRETVAIARIL